MTGFRVALGGACELYSLDPDLVTLGKIVGGGLPVVCLRRETPFHGPSGASRAGLPGRNPQRQSAGHGRRHRHPLLSPAPRRPEVYPQLEATSKSVAQGVATEASTAGVPLTLNRVGSMWTLVLHPRPRQQLPLCRQIRHRRLRPVSIAPCSTRASGCPALEQCSKPPSWARRTVKKKLPATIAAARVAFQAI